MWWLRLKLVWWRALRSPWLAASSSPRRWPADTDTVVTVSATVTVYRVLGSGFRGYWYWYGGAPASRATCRSTSTQTYQAALTFRFESDPSTHFNCRCQKRYVFLPLRETPFNVVPCPRLCPLLGESNFESWWDFFIFLSDSRVCNSTPNMILLVCHSCTSLSVLPVLSDHLRSQAWAWEKHCEFERGSQLLVGTSLGW